MSVHHSTTAAPQGKPAAGARVKPAKPYPEFPLTAHPAGYWCKKIRGKIHYFGPWEDPEGAPTKYLEQKDALHSGRKPREGAEGNTVKNLCNRFLNAKATARDAGELAPRSWDDYKAASPQLKAMILLGINAGFGNTDCGTLPLGAVNLETGWVDFPRPKTGIPRRAHLWPETVQAIREALAVRPAAKKEAHAGLVFLTKYGKPWAKDVADSPVTKETKKLLDTLGIDGHRNFYCLRHTFRTVADEAKDQPAADYIMGHEVAHMSSVYRETISDARLKAVTDHVRRWLFGIP